MRGLDIEIEAGEIVALLGPNGAGKTTTIRALSGMLPTLAGELLFDGKRTHEPVYRRTKRGLAVVTEERSVFMRLTVAENLRVGRCDTDKALDLFPELRPLMRQQAGNLSGGEQQILTLARALARNPTLILADELSLGLAPLVVRRLLDVLQLAAREGVGVLLVEQHIQQAMRVADRVYLLNRGALTTSGTPSEVAPQLQEIYMSTHQTDDR